MKNIILYISVFFTYTKVLSQVVLTSYQPVNYVQNFITAGMKVRYEIGNTNSYSGSGTSIIDLMGNVNATTYGAPTFNTSGIKSMNLSSASSQYIMTNNIGSNYLESSFMWVYLKGNGILLTELGVSALNTSWYDSQIELVNGNLKFGIWPYTLGSPLISSSISTPLNNWYYVGFTYDGSTFNTYVNGVNAGSVPITRQAPANLYYAIGGASNSNMGNGGYGNFNLGAFHYYNRALTANEVKLNYDSTKANFNNAVYFTQTYTSGVAPGAAIETAFNTFRASLTGSYSTFKIYSNLNPTGITVTDATQVPLIANALRTATIGSWTIGANTWKVDLNCGSPSIGGDSVIFTNSSTGCNCGTGSIYTIRPDINNYNWGGIGGECSQPTQTLTLVFY